MTGSGDSRVRDSIARESKLAENRDAFMPVVVVDIELTKPLPVVGLGSGCRRTWILARLWREPIGTLLIETDQAPLTREMLGRRLWEEFSSVINARFAETGLPSRSGIPASGFEDALEQAPLLLTRAQATNEVPFISVVVCTRDRPHLLERCISSLRLQEYPHFEVIVVDNAPTGDLVHKLIAEVNDGDQYRYVLEPMPGLSRARNTGVAAAKGEIVAFLDDDDEADSFWLVGIARGFARDGRIGCVTGSVLPARLDTVAQELYEQLGGHQSGRGFAPKRFSRSGPQNPLFPLPPFGVGANMAFSRSALTSIEGFDVALGAGTPTAACEDTLAMTLALLEGYEIAYEPSAVMWHHHRREIEDLERQLHGYSIGLAAFYTALLRHRPRTLFGLLKLIPSFAGYIRSARGASAAPSALSQVKRRHFAGLIVGSAAYIGSTVAQHWLMLGSRRRARKELKL